MAVEFDLFGVVERFPAPRFIAVDFFCGAGGTTRGLIDAGGYVVAGVDRDDSGRKTYLANNRNLTYRGDRPLFLDREVLPWSRDNPRGQQELVGTELSIALETVRNENPNVPLMFALCSPSQPATNLARKPVDEERRGERSKDAGRFREAARLVEKFLPDIVLAETVAAGFEGLEETLETLGYAVGSRTVSAERFGIAQIRRRSVLVAVKLERVAVSLDPSGRLVLPDRDRNAPVPTVASVLGRFPPIAAGERHPDVPNHVAAGLSEINLRRIALARPGESNDYLRENGLELDCHIRARQKTGGIHRSFTDVYTRMSPDKPAPTITTNCTSISNGRFGHYDMSQNRAISLREAAALQSFPDDYVFHPQKSSSAVARQIGSAFPPKLACFFAEFALRAAGVKARKSAA